jgi:hypothetical protein
LHKLEVKLSKLFETIKSIAIGNWSLDKNLEVAQL